MGFEKDKKEFINDIFALGVNFNNIGILEQIERLDKADELYNKHIKDLLDVSKAEGVSLPTVEDYKYWYAPDNSKVGGKLVNEEWITETIQDEFDLFEEFMSEFAVRQ